MFTHIQIGARDWPRLVDFYDAVLAPLGLARRNAIDDAGPEGVIWGVGSARWPTFVVAPPFNGLPATWGNGCQVSFEAPSEDVVRQCWTAALAHGAVDEGAPGLRSRYAPDFYAAYCRDPEGNKLAFVCASRHEKSTAGPSERPSANPSASPPASSPANPPPAPQSSGPAAPPAGTATAAPATPAPDPGEDLSAIP